MRISAVFLLPALILAPVYAAPGRALLTKLPLRFEANTGDRASGVKFSARRPGLRLDLSARENSLEWQGPSGATGKLRTRLLNAAANVHLEAEQPLAGEANYFVGGQSTWRTNVHAFGRVRYRGIYPGIDLLFHGEEGRLEYDFVLAPHADPRAIAFSLDGAESVRIDTAAASKGELVIETSAGEVRWKAPDIYQDLDGRRVPASGGFVIDGKTIRFELGPYDSSGALIIDPALKYSTYIGGTYNEAARGIALDGQGNVYVAGASSSVDLPVTANGYQPTFAGRTALNNGEFTGDGFVAKFSPAGTLLYLTYLGGSQDDGIAAIAVDTAGNAYLTGGTNSTDFPTKSPYQSKLGGTAPPAPGTDDAFFAKLSPDGSTLLVSTYLGGNNNDIGLSIALDSTGNIYLCGATASSNFPTVSPVQPGFGGAGGEPIRHDYDVVPEWEPGDAFLAKFDPTGTKLMFSTFLGGSDDDAAFSIAVDNSGNAYVGGCTISGNFPHSTGAYQTVFGGMEQQNFFFHMGDGFIAKYNTTTNTQVYSTFVGGVGDDCISSIAIDSAGDVYMTGSSSTPNLPVSSGAVQARYAGYNTLPFEVFHLFGDAFAAKLNPAGNKLLYLTYLGGQYNDGGMSIAIDSSGNAYILGFTDSFDFPTTAGAMQTKLAGDGGVSLYLFYGDAFLSVLNPTATQLLYSTYFGGNEDDRPMGITLDGAGNVYMVGNTVSPGAFPVTSNALQSKYQGFKGHANGTPRGDAFYSVISGFGGSAPAISSVINAAGGAAANVAPNTWVEITGANLSNTTRPWGDSDFINNQLPIMLDGVTVTINGENAYVYYISPKQINILTPPDIPTSGTLNVQVSVQGIPSSTFQVAAQPASTSFFQFAGGPYVAATHLNYTLIGPTSLYPGATTPASRGETIVIYANGFGPVNPAVTKGSEFQSGTLPGLPTVQIGGIGASVTFAGVISPGLYQFNVVVPQNAPTGDDVITAQFAGQVTPAGSLITVQ